MRKMWKVIEDCPNYEVSNFGEVRNIRTGRILKGSTNKYGYYRVTLPHQGKYVTSVVHRLVAFAFVEGYFEGAHINHKDGVKQNNRANNLEWVTHLENIAHAVSTGLIRKMRKWRVR